MATFDETVEEMADLVASLTERAEAERRERELATGLPDGGAADSSVGAPPPSAPSHEAAAAGGSAMPEAPPEDDDDDDDYD